MLSLHCETASTTALTTVCVAKLALLGMPGRARLNAGIGDEDGGESTGSNRDGGEAAVPRRG